MAIWKTLLLAGGILGAVTFRVGDAQATPVTDVMGDAVTGAHATYDITSIDAVFSLTSISFTINLSGAPLAPSSAPLAGLSGFIDIDIDLAPTGAGSNVSAAGNQFPGFGSSGLGIEYYVDLFSEAQHAGFVDVKDPINVLNITTAPITYGPSSVTVIVPLSNLGNDDGLVNYAVLVGDSAAPTDQAVDAGIIQAGGSPAQSSPVPEPSTGLLLTLGLTWIALRRP